MSFFWWFLKDWTQKSKSRSFTYLTPNSLSHVGICFPLPPKNLKEMAFLWGKMYHLVPYPRYNSPRSWALLTTLQDFDDRYLFWPNKSKEWCLNSLGNCCLLGAFMRSWHDLWPWKKTFNNHRVLFQTFWPTRKHDSINQGSPSSPRWPTFLLLDLDRPCQVWHHECEGFYHCDFSISWWPNCFVLEKMGQYHSKRRNITRWTRAQKWSISSEDVQKWWLNVISRHAGRTCPLKTEWDKWWYKKQLCMVKQC